MSWYAISQLPKTIRDAILNQPFDKYAWACGCRAGTGDENDPLVWFCQYHEGAYDFCGEECE